MTVPEATDRTEHVYGYVIRAYSCDCPDHPHEHIEWRENRWQLTMAGVAWGTVAEQTVEELKAAHVNLRPLIPKQIQALIDQIQHWELRALRAEAAAVDRG